MKRLVLSARVTPDDLYGLKCRYACISCCPTVRYGVCIVVLYMLICKFLYYSYYFRVAELDLYKIFPLPSIGEIYQRVQLDNESAEVLKEAIVHGKKSQSHV